MIILVLEATCQHTFGLNLDRIAIEIHTRGARCAATAHGETKAGYGEAALNFVRLEVFTVFGTGLMMCPSSPPMR